MTVKGHSHLLANEHEFSAWNYALSVSLTRHKENDDGCFYTDTVGSVMSLVLCRFFLGNAVMFYDPVSTLQTGMLDLSQLDVILLSNYRCMMALPFITEFAGFKGVVYATEPTLHLGRYFYEAHASIIEKLY